MLKIHASFIALTVEICMQKSVYHLCSCHPSVELAVGKLENNYF